MAPLAPTLPPYRLGSVPQAGGNILPVAWGEWLAGLGFEAFATLTGRQRPRSPVFLKPQTHDRRQPYRPARTSSVGIPTVTVEFLLRNLRELDLWAWENNGGYLPWWVAAVEPHRGRGPWDYHLHVLMGGLRGLQREAVWRWWYKHVGRARVLPMEEGAAFYVAKYAAKEGGIYFSETFRQARLLSSHRGQLPCATTDATQHGAQRSADRGE